MGSQGPPRTGWAWTRPLGPTPGPRAGPTPAPDRPGPSDGSPSVPGSGSIGPVGRGHGQADLTGTVGTRRARSTLGWAGRSAV
nr:MAG TPA: hypothetical protein [Caudoviricetes sp.]